MTLEEIREECKRIIQDKNFDKNSWERLEKLRTEEERILKRIHFHFEDDICVSQIQLFAKVFKCFINGPYVLEDKHLVQLTLPVECKNVDALKQFAKRATYVGMFYVTTPKYDSLEYTTVFQKQIPDMWVSLDLLSLQDDYQKVREFPAKEDVNTLVYEMGISYTLSNSAIGHNLFFENYDLGGYRFFDKVAPNITYVDIIRTLRTTISIASEHSEDKNMVVYAKYQLLNFAYQCRYLSFWSCLIDIMSFPGLSQAESDVLNKVAGWFLNNLTNPYVYHLSCESNHLNQEVGVESRESGDNPTRIKIYLTKTDDMPILVRFDLPHKGEPYVHLNVECNGNNEHFRLSSDVNDGSLDHVFDNLAESLRSFNFNGSFFYHSPVCKDREIIKRMPEYTAMMNLSTYMEGLAFGLAFDDISESIKCSLRKSIKIIEDIVRREIGDVSSLTLPELYLYADMILEKELQER